MILYAFNQHFIIHKMFLVFVRKVNYNNQNSEKRYKYKLTHWLTAIIYIRLIGVWLFCSELPTSAMAIFIAALIGGFIIREIYWFSKI